MARKKEQKKQQDKQQEPKGYPSYPRKEDIYNQADERQDIDPSDPSKKKEADPDRDNVKRGRTLVGENQMGSDLDVPGSELDDPEEKIGSEDEENNYYSIGGEKDLEEEHSDDDLRDPDARNVKS